MRSLFYCVVLLHLIFWVSCIGSPRSREVKEPESSAELLSDSSLTDFDFEGSWHWFADDDEASVSMKILSHKDSVGYYLYIYYCQKTGGKLLIKKQNAAQPPCKYPFIRIFPGTIPAKG